MYILSCARVAGSRAKPLSKGRTRLKGWVSGPSGVSGFAGDPTSLACDNIILNPYYFHNHILEGHVILLDNGSMTVNFYNHSIVHNLDINFFGLNQQPLFSWLGVGSS